MNTDTNGFYTCLSVQNMGLKSHIFDTNEVITPASLDDVVEQHFLGEFSVMLNFEDDCIFSALLRSGPYSERSALLIPHYWINQILAGVAFFSS